jgi:hypothetical protein
VLYNKSTILQKYTFFVEYFILRYMFTKWKQKFLDIYKKFMSKSQLTLSNTMIQEELGVAQRVNKIPCFQETR